MTPIEVNVFLTKAAAVDPRLKRSNQIDQADMAEGWAAVLHDVELGAALTAMYAFYRAERGPIMPADILHMVGVVDEEPQTMQDLTAVVLAESRRRTLAAAGVTEEEFAAHEHDVEWVRAHLGPALALEEPRIEFWNGEVLP